MSIATLRTQLFCEHFVINKFNSTSKVQNLGNGAMQMVNSQMRITVASGHSLKRMKRLENIAKNETENLVQISTCHMKNEMGFFFYLET